ncbi:MAG: EGF domain-containing protein [Myxococcales bacterium]|nr:EGF domain-containing protein [Myxococcales bacterium]
MRLSAFVALAFAVLLAGCPTASPPCGPSNCTGCCDTTGQCQSGLTTQACGSAGAACSACSVSDTCSFGKCMVSGPFNQGGGSAGGSTGGGATGGGTAGGGTAGGSSAGGAADAGAPDAGAPDAGQPNPCAGTLTFCSTRCLDLSADPENCGVCGRLCGQGQVCNRGQCAVLPDDCTASGMGCGAGFFCDPVTKRCLTGCRLTSDCPMGATCGSGTCSCPTGEHACGQTCVSNDAVASCGNRCSTCAQPANSTATCTASACGFTCASGYRDTGGACLDIDECLTGNGGCSANAACANTPGSRTCTCNAGFTGDGVTCTDVNECLTNNGGCDVNAACTNTPGARTCACNGGFTGNGVTCTDINECSTNNGGCAAQATCTNTPGARTCACNAGFTGTGLVCADVNECLTNNGGCSANGSCTNTPGSRSCACNAGFMGDGVTCTDVNECLSGNGGCDTNATCTNTTGSRTCMCNSGFTGTGLTCTDVNECLTNNGGCASVSSGGACTNTPGSRTCACTTGFMGDGFTCADVNECLTNNGGCAAVASGGLCTNTPGSRTCACSTGYSGTGLTCADINECLTNNGGCAAVASGGVCTNTPGSRTCACATGYSGTGLTCADVNECLTNNGGCAAVASGGVCTNTPGSRTCGCASGFNGDGFTCADINECLTNNGGCAAPSVGGVCTNTPGSRTCSCGPGSVGSGFTCNPSGDTCVLPLGVTAGSPVTATLVGQNGDYSGALGSACGNAVSGPDVVHAFTPTSTAAYRITTTVLTGSWNPRTWVSATCGGRASCLASDPELFSPPAPFVIRGTAGVPLFIHVSSDRTQVGTYSLTVTQVTPPPNDTCATATPLTLGVPVTGTTDNAVHDGPLYSPFNFRRGDVMHTFTPPSDGLYVFKETSATEVVMQLRVGCTGAFVAAGPDLFQAQLSAGTSYMVFLQPGSRPTGSAYTLVVEAAPRPVNDTCTSPTPLTVGVPVAGTTIGASNDVNGPLSMVCRAFTIPAPDVVYSFTAPTAGNYKVTTTGVLVTPGYYSRVWTSATCGGASTCNDGDPQQGELPFTMRLAAGATTYIHVDSIYPESLGTFTIQVDAVAAPPNDTCSSPTALTLNVPAVGDLAGAVDDLQATMCTPVSSYSAGEVVFTFTPASSGSYRFRETDDTYTVLWVSTACDNTCLAGTTTEDLTVALTGGVTYFVMLEANGTPGPFSLLITP